MIFNYLELALVGTFCISLIIVALIEIVDILTGGNENEDE